MIGVTALASGKLLVGNKPVGKASLTFLSIFDGTMPEREYIYHPWLAHAAMKAVPSATMPNRHYLARSDNSEASPFLDHIMDVYEPLAATRVAARGGPQSLSDVPFVDETADSLTSTTLTKAGIDFIARGVNPGDHLLPGEDRNITAVSATQITVSPGGFDPVNGTTTSPSTSTQGGWGRTSRRASCRAWPGWRRSTTRSPVRSTWSSPTRWAGASTSGPTRCAT